MPTSGVEQMMSIVKPAYDAAGHPERFKVYQPESNHVYTEQYFEWVVEWVREVLLNGPIPSWIFCVTCVEQTLAVFSTVGGPVEPRSRGFDFLGQWFYCLWADHAGPDW